MYSITAMKHEINLFVNKFCHALKVKTIPSKGILRPNPKIPMSHVKHEA